jgi:hypothetical protein
VVAATGSNFNPLEPIKARGGNGTSYGNSNTWLVTADAATSSNEGGRIPGDDETTLPHPLAPPKFSKIKFQKITPKFPPKFQPQKITPKLLRFFSRYNFAKKIKKRERVL